MLNQCNFIGRLGRDPETKYLPGGDPVCNFSIALDESYKNKSGEKVNKTEWVNIIAFRKLAEICGNYLQKGSLVYIGGRIQTRSWEDKEGVKRYSTDIVANTMKMLGGKKEQTDSGYSDSTSPSGSDEDCPF